MCSWLVEKDPSVSLIPAVVSSAAQTGRQTDVRSPSAAAMTTGARSILFQLWAGRSANSPMWSALLVKPDTQNGSQTENQCCSRIAVCLTVQEASWCFPWKQERSGALRRRHFTAKPEIFSLYCLQTEPPWLF